MLALKMQNRNLVKVVANSFKIFINILSAIAIRDFNTAKL